MTVGVGGVRGGGCDMPSSTAHQLRLKPDRTNTTQYHTSSLGLGGGGRGRGQGQVAIGDINTNTPWGKQQLAAVQMRIRAGKRKSEKKFSEGDYFEVCILSFEISCWSTLTENWR